MNKKIIFFASLVLFLGLASTSYAACLANQILPDSACTPGAVLTTNVKTICTVGYTKTVRDVSDATKKKVFAEYGIDWGQHSNYEVDHLISLEIGGSNDIKNLWPENSKITDGSLTKDKFENYLHAQVCSGKITIANAQKEIATNWLQYYSGTSATPAKTTVAPKITSTIPTGATGKCNDGSYTFAINHRGACSHHGGVSQWY